MEENVFAIPPDQVTNEQLKITGATRYEYVQRYNNTEEQFKDEKFGVKMEQTRYFKIKIFLHTL